MPAVTITDCAHEPNARRFLWNAESKAIMAG